jgi:hypothetical protein
MLLGLLIGSLLWAVAMTASLFATLHELTRYRLKNHYFRESESVARHCWHLLRWDVGGYCEYSGCELGTHWGHHHDCGLGFSAHVWAVGWGLVDEGMAFGVAPRFVWPAGAAGVETIERRLNSKETWQLKVSGWQPQLELIDLDRMSSAESPPVLFGESGNVSAKPPWRICQEFRV